MALPPAAPSEASITIGPRTSRAKTDRFDEDASLHQDQAPKALLVVALSLIVLAGVALRISAALHSTLSVDEAESSINALTILRHGYPVDEYLSMPIYENTLTIPWPDSDEYEFRDSSYSSKGIAVYHGWLPLYAIAAAEALAGITPDAVPEPPRLLHGHDSALRRTLAPRLPAILFSAGFLFLIGWLAWQIAGFPAALVAATWAAFSERLVLLGYQARYYSMTLFMTVVVAIALWGVMRHGRWRNFMLLGLAEGLLFHTHQLSAVILAQISLLTFPVLMRHERWFAKSALAAGLAGVLTIPWAWICGFFESADSVPKAYELFTSWTDWLAYPAAPTVSLAMLAGTLIVIQCARLSPRWLPRVFCERIHACFPSTVVLVGWLSVAFVTMHFLVPAASYFSQRLTLILQVPGILLISIVAGSAAVATSRRWAPALAFVATLAGLWGSGKLAAFQGFDSDLTEAPLATAFSKRTFEPGTRFYATPNLHLKYSYYTGLPIQSVAAVRRSFLNSYPGPIVFIEHRHMPAFPRASEIVEAAERAGQSLREDEINEFIEAIWIQQVIAELGARGLPVPAVTPLPAYLEDVLAATRTRWQATEARYVAQQREHPIFRELAVDNAADLWMSFFYRFVDYRSRLGGQSNIFARLQHAEIEPRPKSMAVIYSCSPLRFTSPPASSEPQPRSIAPFSKTNTPPPD
ncbi:MAG TPA: hypothetical protein VGD81_00780 [Opitutaceae bacterium]